MSAATTSLVSPRTQNIKIAVCGSVAADKQQMYAMEESDVESPPIMEAHTHDFNTDNLITNMNTCTDSSGAVLLTQCELEEGAVQ